MHGDHKLKIVMLTNGNVHGMRILEGLKAFDIYLDYVVLETKDHLSDHLYKTKQHYLIQLAKAIRRYILSIKLTNRVERQLRQYSNVIRAGTLNSKEMCAALESIKPDLIVLGGIGIISNEIIKIPRFGVLNAHPCLLPWLRGTGVVGRAIERKIPVGATCHFVDCYVDTGNIIERRLLPLSERYYSLQELELKADKLASTMIVNIIKKIVCNNEMPKSYEQTEKFTVCRWMTEDEKAKLSEKLVDLEPSNLLKQWASNCIDQIEYKLHIDKVGNCK
jgi:folate-dependent phosphoribosylglycinamide formyltransferase PurN